MCAAVVRRVVTGQDLVLSAKVRKCSMTHVAGFLDVSLGFFGKKIILVLREVGGMNGSLVFTWDGIFWGRKAKRV